MPEVKITDGKVKFNIRYAKNVVKYLEPFFCMKEELACDVISSGNAAAAEKIVTAPDKAGAEGALRKLEEKLLAGRKIVDGESSAEPVIPEKYRALLEKFETVTYPAKIELFPHLSGCWDLLVSCCRGNYSGAKGICLTPESAITLRREFNLYWEERYSVSFKSPDLWLALEACPASAAIKGDACLRVYAADAECFYIDDANKYCRLPEMFKGLRG